MNQLLRIGVCLALLCTWGCSAAQSALDSDAPAASSDHAQVTPDPGDHPPDAAGWGIAAGLHYREVLRGGATAEQRVPTFIMIHGMGGSATTDWVDALDVGTGRPARVILPQAPTPASAGFSWFEYSPDPQTRDDHKAAQGIAAAAHQLSRLLRIVQVHRAVRGRPIVSGFSQGGMLSYALALIHPELVEHAVPVSGYLPRELWPETAAAASGRTFSPITALHGSADKVVDFDADAQLVQHLQRLGYRAQFAPFADVGHQVTPAMRVRWSRALRSAVP
jgi:phospholipase/carboxylesterase